MYLWYSKDTVTYHAERRENQNTSLTSGKVTRINILCITHALYDGMILIPNNYMSMVKMCQMCTLLNVEFLKLNNQFALTGKYASGVATVARGTDAKTTFQIELDKPIHESCGFRGGQPPFSDPSLYCILSRRKVNELSRTKYLLNLIKKVQFLCPGLKGPPWTSSNWIVRPSVCPFVRPAYI